MEDLTEDEKARLREFVINNDAAQLVFRFVDVMVERYRDALETSHDDPRFYQGTLNGIRAIRNGLKAFGAPKQEYEANQEAFEHFRHSRRNSSAVY